MASDERACRRAAPGACSTGAVVLVALAALALRLAWGAATLPDPSAELSDTLWYHQTATLLAQGRGYVNPFTGEGTAAWPPGYPLALAAFYAALGPSPAWGLLLNAAAGALTCVACWRLGIGASAALRGGLYAALLVALFPSLVFFAPLLLSESVFAGLASLLLLAGARLLEAGPRPAPFLRWVRWGAGVGVATLVRAEGASMLLIPPLTAASLRDRTSAARALIAGSLGAVLVLAPWTLRNAAVFGTFVPVSTSFGRTFWLGHNPAATGGMKRALHEIMASTVEREYAGLPGPQAELARSRRYTRLAIDYALAHPCQEIGLLFLRIYHLFRGDHVWSSWYPTTPGAFLLSQVSRRWLGRLSDSYYLAVLILAGVGCLRWRPARRPLPRVLQLFVGLWVLVFAFIYGDPRFHLPLLPVFSVMAAQALVTCAEEQGQQPAPDQHGATD